MFLLKDKGGRTGKGERLHNIHNTSQNAGIAYRHHLNNRNRDRYNTGGRWPPYQSTQSNDNIRWVILQKQNNGYPPHCHDKIRNGTQHTNGYNSFCLAVHTGFLHLVSRSV